MGDGIPMTPREYLAKLNALIGAGRDEDALELAARVGPDVTPKLTDEQFFRVSSMLEGAELAVSTGEAVPARGGRTRRAGPDGGPPAAKQLPRREDMRPRASAGPGCQRQDPPGAHTGV
jgi:hypothetical protein